MACLSRRRWRRGRLSMHSCQESDPCPAEDALQRSIICIFGRLKICSAPARLFSIDPPTARDLDDALSIEDLGNGHSRIGVHIADVSHFIPPGSALDAKAALRATSVYLTQRVIPMLPPLLCEELCSLNPGACTACLQASSTVPSNRCCCCTREWYTLTEVLRKSCLPPGNGDGMQCLEISSPTIDRRAETISIDCDGSIKIGMGGYPSESRVSSPCSANDCLAGNIALPRCLLPRRSS